MTAAVPARPRRAYLRLSRARAGGRYARLASAFLPRLPGVPRDPATVHADRRLVGIRLANARLKAQFRTQLDAAVALGRPQSFVSDVETGQRRVDVVELLDFAAVYQFEPCDIIGPPRDSIERGLHREWETAYRERLAAITPPADDAVDVAAPAGPRPGPTRSPGPSGE